MTRSRPGSGPDFPALSHMISASISSRRSFSSTSIAGKPSVLEALPTPNSGQGRPVSRLLRLALGPSNEIPDLSLGQLQPGADGVGLVPPLPAHLPPRVTPSSVTAPTSRTY